MNRSSVLARFCLCLIVLTVLITFFISKGHPYSHIFFNPEKEVAEEAYVSMSAIVTGKTERENGQTLILKTKNLICQNQSAGAFCFLIYDAPEAELKIGDHVTVSGTIEYFEYARNPGCFDLHFYHGVRGIGGMIKPASMTVERKSFFSLKEIIYRFSVRSDQVIRTMMGEEYGSVLSSMILGKKSMIDSDVKELYQKNGVAHVLAISGLHLSLIAQGLCYLLKRAKCSFYLRHLATILFLSGYLIMTGFQIALVRAFIMLIIKTIAAMTGRCYDALTALLVTAVIILAAEPFYLWDVSFQLTFAALLPICSFEANKPAKNRSSFQTIKKQLKDWIIESLSLSAFVMLFTAPFLFWHFFEAAPLSVMVNLIMIPLLTLIVAGGITGIILSSCIPIIGSYAAFIPFSLTAGCLWVYKTVCKAVALLPFYRLVTGRPVKVVMVICIFVLSVALFIRRCLFSYRRVRMISLTAAVVLVIITAFSRRIVNLFDHDTHITMLDIGQGDCFYISDGGGHSYLIDGGSSSVEHAAKYRIEPFILSQAVTQLDGVFISHGDDDHVNGIEEMLQRQSIGVRFKRVYITEQFYDDDHLLPLAENVIKSKVQLIRIRSGDSIRTGSVNITCLGPPQHDQDTGPLPSAGNEASMILRLDRGKFSMLFTGDVEGAGEQILCEQVNGQHYDVLKTAHHGSKNSTSREVLDLIQPKVCLISAGKNNLYGHPDKKTLQRIKEAGSRSMCTIDKGAVTISTDGEKMKIKCAFH